MAETGFVYNHDIAGLYRRINRFIVELARSTSSSGSQMSSFDQRRLATYLDAVDAYKGWVVSQPQLDLPETFPRKQPLEAAPVILDSDLENESVIDVIRMFEVARDEAINSQSARQASGMVSFDDTRLTAIIAKARSFLETYIAVVTPLDLPESSPVREMTKPGAVGV